MRRYRMTTALLLTLAIGCTASPPQAEGPFVANEKDPRYRIVAAEAIRISPVSLVAFDACKPLLKHLRDQGAKRVTAFGLGYGYGLYGGALEARGSMSTAPMMAPMPASADASTRSAGGGTDYSTTNVQEAGVDEPDIVKSDGKRILAIAAGRLHWVGLTDGKATLLQSLTLPGNAWARDMLLAGDRALVFTSEPFLAADQPAVSRDAMMSYPYGGEGSAITIVDVARPSSMRIVSTLKLEGSYVAARMIDGIARVVIRSGPSGIVFPAVPNSSTPGQYEENSKKAQIKNKDVVKQSTLDQWLPNYRLEQKSGPGKKVTEGRISSCENTHRTKEFSGFGATSVLTLDPDNPAPRKATTVLGDAQTVYASAQRLYVATQKVDAPVAGGPARMAPIQVQTQTQIHSFDITDPQTAQYMGSGVVDGTVLNQWSLSEHKGHLRVATTTYGKRQESGVAVMALRPGALVQVGRVGGLGINERIYGVRFIGDLGYVVTFRQVDPLYVLDLSNPASPRKRGELKIPGYSAYLHPVGDGLLLGVGAAATNEGRRTGMQVSLFDVSDPQNPNRMHLATIENAYTEVEQTHLAFLWWPKRNLAIVPVQGNNGSWMQGFRVDKQNGIDDAGIIRHDQPGASGAAPDMAWMPVQRAIVVGDQILTFSETGVMTSAIDGLARKAWTAWPAPPVQR